MKIPIQYVTDVSGKPQAVQMPVSEWEKVIKKLKKYEDALKLRSDLKEALNQVASLNTGTKKKQSLNDFLDEL